MDIRVTGINFRHTADGEIENVSIRHEGTGAEHTITNHGQIVITKEEYESNIEIEQLAVLVRERLTSELNAE